MKINTTSIKKLFSVSLFTVTFLLAVFTGCSSNNVDVPQEVVNPSAVTNFKAYADNGFVTLKWTNPQASTFESIKLYKGDTNPPETFITEITDGSTSYKVTGLTNDKKYYFKAVAYFTGEENAYESSIISATPAEQFIKTSVNFAKELVIGWNLGNTLDAYNDSSNNSGLSAETSWGMPYTTKDMIDAVAAAGFKTIRIPVSWHNHLTDTTNYTIDSDWMARVKEIVDWAIEDGMYVILNVHHDNQTASNIATGAGKFGFAISTTSTTVQNKSKTYLGKVWTQIANTFKDYDEKLIFEVLNEPRDVGSAFEWYMADSTKAKSYCDVITDYENTCISAIRSTGGNNEYRYIMVPSYAASGTMQVTLSNYTLPTDTAADKLLLSTHAYSPNYFAMADSDATFGSDDEASLTSIFNFLKTNYTDKGIGVVMGEASASNKNNTAERIKWVNDYFTKAKNAGIPVVLWDNMIADPDGNENVEGGYNGEHHGWLNRKSGTWYFPSIIKAMMDTVGVTGYSIPEYVAPTASSIGWNESNAVTVSNEQKTIDWNSEYKPSASSFANAKEGSILKVSFTASGATLRLTSADWKTDYNTGDMLNGQASGTNINVTASEFYYILTASDATAWKSKGLTISGANGTITSIKFLANPSVN